VVDELAKSDTVVTVFPLDGQRVAGPEVRRVPDEARRGGIEMVVAGPAGGACSRTCHGLITIRAIIGSTLLGGV
jgi:hypothetical protein